LGALLVDEPGDQRWRGSVKGHNLHVSNASYNMLLTALRALGERANAELKKRWKCLCPNRIGDIVAAGSCSAPSKEETTEKPQRSSIGFIKAESTDLPGRLRQGHHNQVICEGDCVRHRYCVSAIVFPDDS